MYNSAVGGVRYIDQRLGERDRIPAERKKLLEELAREDGFPYHDLAPAFRDSANAGRLPWWPDDTHTNPTGHAIAARVLAPWIRTWLAAHADSAPASAPSDRSGLLVSAAIRDRVEDVDPVDVRQPGGGQDDR